MAERVEAPGASTSVAEGHGLRLVTERLVLRDIQAGDVEAMQQYWAEPESHAHILRSQRDPAHHARLLQLWATYNERVPAWNREQLALAVCRGSDGLLLGNCTMRYLDRRSMIIGWHYGVAHAGQGYATEAARALARFAFDELDMQWVMADCFEANLAVVAVLRKLGMRRLPGRWRDWLRGLGYRELRPTIRHYLHRDVFEADAQRSPR